MTGKYPDVAEIVKEALADDVTSIVLDSEVVAWDFENSKILPFQTLTTRKRKDVSVENVTVPICLFPFDCIYYNDRSLAKLSFRERREYLHKAVKTIPGRLQFARFMNLEDPDDIQAFLGESVDDACEGLMIKTLDKEATYEPSKRSTSWLKLKKDYIDGLTDSVDLVPMGGWYGKGKRTGWFGNFILGIYDPDREEYQSICKAGTGFSDAALEEHKTFFGNEQNQLKTKPNYYNINEKLTPDVWFVPCQVWECKAADLSISPIHTATYGMRAETKGIGLRFPRFLHIRTDKNCQDCTSPEQIVDMYDAQFKKSGDFVKTEDDDDD
eukprot:GHVL01020238.1.p2 GENE.GHVL01020238.1~~GHVL01020238.1.p2  ORF type:complete len:326 (-),score=54.35 GHVL01020238.1:126-1103(-)